MIKKIIISLLTFILLVVLAGFSLFILPFTGTKKIQPDTVFPGGKVFNAVDGFAQVFIIDGGNREIALVDAGKTPDGKKIVDVLASHGLKAADVKAVFLTHGHSDHIAAAKVFPGARIYCMKDEVDLAEGRVKYDSPVGKFFPPELTGLKITDTLKDGDSVMVGSVKVNAYAIPGHTAGGAAYLADGVLFLGDAALSSGDGKISHAVWIFSSDVEQQNRSLKALAGRLLPLKDSIKYIVFAHSGQLEGIQPLVSFAESVKQ